MVEQADTAGRKTMRNLVVSAWVTLDGVFDADTMDQWFNPYHSDARAAYIQETILASDAFLLGRTTYDMLAPYWSAMKNNEMGVADRLNSAPKYVVSSTLATAEWNNSRVINERVVEEVASLKAMTGQDILIMGSAALVQLLMPTNLIDEYRFLIHPSIMGRGKRFFKDGMHTTMLQLVKSTTFDLGVSLLCYQPAKE